MVAMPASSSKQTLAGVPKLRREGAQVLIRKIKVKSAREIR